MGIIWFNRPLDTLFLDRFGDGGVTAASARIVGAVSAEVSAAPQGANWSGSEKNCDST